MKRLLLFLLATTAALAQNPQLADIENWFYRIVTLPTPRA